MGGESGRRERGRERRAGGGSEAQGVGSVESMGGLGWVEAGGPVVWCGVVGGWLGRAGSESRLGWRLG